MYLLIWTDDDGYTSSNLSEPEWFELLEDAEVKFLDLIDDKDLHVSQVRVWDGRTGKLVREWPYPGEAAWWKAEGYPEDRIAFEMQVAGLTVKIYYDTIHPGCYGFVLRDKNGLIPRGPNGEQPLYTSVWGIEDLSRAMLLGTFEAQDVAKKMG